MDLGAPAEKVVGAGHLLDQFPLLGQELLGPTTNLINPPSRTRFTVVGRLYFLKFLLSSFMMAGSI